MKQSIVLFMSLLLLLASCKKDETHRYSRESTAMETFVSVSIYDEDITQDNANALIDSAFAEINRIEQVMTDYADTSEVGIVNVSAGKETVQISSELSEVLKTSTLFSEQSNGAFDVTVGPIVRKWNFLAEVPHVPSDDTIKKLLNLVGYKNLTVMDRKVWFNKEGMRIDLGAIAKGYAVDRAIETLKRHGVKNVLVDLGGNLGVWWEGTHSLDSSIAEISIRHPRKDGKFFGSFKVGTCGVSTSGDYQRFFMNNGIRYHHIINPATGYPATDVVSVTIIAEDAMTADALSTLVFVLGRKEGMEFIAKSHGVEGLIVWEDGATLSYELSAGLLGKFKRSDD